jgi:glycosyltransferase involved in cell wall biosynthesis
MNVPLLTICIATYNRAGYIGQTIESIIPQLSDDVELLVVDGASTDGTDDIVRSYVDIDQRIRYIRLDEKGGVDQDYCKSVEFARGEYCWLFTDDDLLKPGAVVAVTAEILAGNCLIIVNSEICNSDFTETLIPRKICADNNRIFTPDAMESFFVYAANYLSFIGAVVIKRDLWLSREKEKYFGTEFVHFGVIFQKTLPGHAIVIAEPYVRIRYGNGQWKPRGFEVWMIKWPRLVWSFAQFSSKSKQSIIRREPCKNLAVLLYERGIGAYAPKHYRTYMSGLSGSRLWKLCARAIAGLPEKAVATILYWFCRLFLQNKMFLYDLKYNK